VSELAQIVKWYGALLGAKGQPVRDDQLRAEGLSYQTGKQRIEFLMPNDAASPLVNWMREFGSSPYSALLKSENSANQPLDSRLTHGANLFVT